MLRSFSRLWFSGFRINLPVWFMNQTGLLLRSFPREEVLLGESGEWTEVNAAELGELRHAPVVEAIATRERFQDPHIHGERLESAGAEEQHAIRNFLAHARQRTKTLL